MYSSAVNIEQLYKVTTQYVESVLVNVITEALGRKFDAALDGDKISIVQQVGMPEYKLIMFEGNPLGMLTVKQENYKMTIKFEPDIKSFNNSPGVAL